MALSNIFNEPSKEIKETVVGLVAISIFLVIDYYFSLWFQSITGGDKGCPWQLGMLFIGPFATVLLITIPFFIHFVGEEICDLLDW